MCCIYTGAIRFILMVSFLIYISITPKGSILSCAALTLDAAEWGREATVALSQLSASPDSGVG